MYRLRRRHGNVVYTTNIIDFILVLKNHGWAGSKYIIEQRTSSGEFTKYDIPRITTSSYYEKRRTYLNYNIGIMYIITKSIMPTEVNNIVLDYLTLRYRLDPYVKEIYRSIMENRSLNWRTLCNNTPHYDYNCADLS